MARGLLWARRMARLDATAVWFQRGEDVEAMAATPAAGEEPRRLPTLAWVIGAVVLTAAIFACVLIHVTHAARVVDEPLANPAAAATAPAAATTTQAATTTTTTAAASPLAQPASTAAAAPATKARAADGERLLRHGRPAAALALFQQTLAQNPGDARAQRGACVALGRLGRARERARRCGHRG
jgi:Flp pilus assembly protein TadD